MSTSKERIIDNIVDLLICNVSSWSYDKQKELEDDGTLSLYANDYTYSYLDLNNIVLEKREVAEITDKVIKEYKKLGD